MFDYSQINSKVFEKIAKEYLENMYPEYHWEPTPLIGDGNKDVLCKFKVLGMEQEYWAEAKFTPSSNPHTLLKGQLDPTLVSALLSSKTVSLCFISNNRMTEQYLYRLKDFKIKTNIGIELVLKEQFEQWLLTHPKVLDKYNIKVTSLNTRLENSKTSIIGATITDIFNIDQYKIETHLVVDTIYYIYVIVVGDDKLKNISFKINDSFFALPRNSKLFDDPNNINIKQGTQVFKFELIPLQIGKTDLNIQLMDNNSVCCQFTIPNLTITSKSNIEIAYAEQEKIQLEITQLIKESDDHNTVIPIIGNGSSGKSKLVQNLYMDFNINTNTVMLSFVGNKYLDAKTLIQLLIFFNIGNVFDYDKNSLISQINQIFDEEKKIYYSNLINGFFCGPGSCINYLKSKIKRQNFSFIYPSYARIQQILILEDIHKISKELREILIRFINEFLECKNNQFLIFSSREYHNDFIINNNTTINTHNWVKKYYLHGLSKEDKITTLNYYLSFDGDIKFNRVTDDIIVFTNIMNSVLNEDDEDNINKKAHIIEAFENPAIVNTFMYKDKIKRMVQYHKIMECVYFINFGIDYLDLISFFKSDDIDFLISQRMIKRIGKKIYPFHDYYVKAYFEDYQISDETIILIKKLSLMSKEDEKKYLYISLLVSCGYSEYCKVEKEAHELEYFYFNNTDYFKAYTLAEALKKYMNLDENLSFEEVYDLFIFAVCSGYFKEPKEVKKNYDDVIQFCKILPQNLDTLGILLRTQSEIINIDYWELNLNNISEKIDKALEGFSTINFNNSNDLLCAYLNLYNRKMVVELLYENFDIANSLFDINLSEIKKYGKNEYIGYLYMDYAKGLYNYDIVQALTYMKKAQDIFMKLGTEYRRLLDCTCEIEYLECIQSEKYDIYKLENAAEALYNSGFIELYAKAKLKLAAIKMVRGTYSTDNIEKELTLSKYVLKYDFTGRLSLFYKMLRNALSVCKLQNNSIVDLTHDEKKTLQIMGSDYQKIWKHNSNIFKNKIVFLSKTHSPHEYVLDARIW